jgi:hypothetical protein
MNRQTEGVEGDEARLESLAREVLGGRIRCFQIHIQDNRLILRGCARTYHAKQLAQHAVMKVTGLPILANEIEVSWAGATLASD